ncbi:MAG: hypothetical protein ACRCV7_06210 [Culicoidibacterales bacterium]
MKEIKKTKQNVYFSIISIFILGLLNVFKMRFLIQNLGDAGDQYNGLYQMLAQMLVYLSIIETSVRFPAISSLFEPFVKRDKSRIASILNGVRSKYINIFCFSLLFGIMMIPLVIIATSQLPLFYVVTISLLFIFRLSVPFLFQEVLVIVNVDNNAYLGTTAINVANIFASIAAIFIILTTQNFLYVVVVETVIVIVVTSLLFVLLKRKYKKFYDTSIPATFGFNDEVSGSRSLRLADALMNNTDIIVISVVLGTIYASSFSTYNATATILFLVVSTTIVEAIKGLLGKVYSQHSNGKIFIEMLHDIKYVNYILISITIPMIFIFLKPFTELFFSPQYEQTYVFIFFFTLYFYLRMIRTPYHALKISMNIYNEFSKITFIYAGLNITLSVCLTYLFGSIGVLIGSTVALLTTEFWFDIQKLEIEEKLFSFKVIVKELIINASITWILSIIGLFVIQPHLTNLITIILLSIPVLIILVIINVITYSFIHPKIKMMIFQRILKK